MIYEDDKILVFFNECDKKYIERLIDIVKFKFDEIVDFFKIKYEDKIVIRLYDKQDKYRTVLEEEFKRQGSVRTYHDWMIANTEDGCINMLSLSVVNKIPGFEEYSEEELCLNACHEFVHLCQQKIKSLSPGWFWEVLACRLGNPECQCETTDEFTLEDLKERFDDIDGYGAAFKIGNYLFANYDKDTILALAKDEGKLYKVMDQYFNSMKLT